MEDPALEQKTDRKEAMTLREAWTGVVHPWENHSLRKGYMLVGEVCGGLSSMGGTPHCHSAGLLSLRRKEQQEQHRTNWNRLQLLLPTFLHHWGEGGSRTGIKEGWKKYTYFRSVSIYYSSTLIQLVNQWQFYLNSNDVVSASQVCP